MGVGSIPIRATIKKGKEMKVYKLTAEFRPVSYSSIYQKWSKFFSTVEKAKREVEKIEEVTEVEWFLYSNVWESNEFGDTTYFIRTVNVD